MNARTCADVTTFTPRRWSTSVPLNLSGFACSTIASSTFLPVAASAHATISSVADGKNCVSMTTSPVGPSIQYDDVENPHVDETYVPTRDASCAIVRCARGDTERGGALADVGAQALA